MYDGFVQRSQILRRVMPDEKTNSEPLEVPVPAMEDRASENQQDPVGENILALLQKATGLAEGNSRYAVEIAQDLSYQLGAAENKVAELEHRVAELETEVRFYRDKSERAEAWLTKISSEIQQKVNGEH
jgi:hypothetical protein